MKNIEVADRDKEPQYEVINFILVEIPVFQLKIEYQYWINLVFGSTYRTSNVAYCIQPNDSAIPDKRFLLDPV